jgi:hypothetical protein
MSWGLPERRDPRAEIGPDTALDQSSIAKFLREARINPNFNFPRLRMHQKEYEHVHDERTCRPRRPVDL